MQLFRIKDSWFLIPELHQTWDKYFCFNFLLLFFPTAVVVGSTISPNPLKFLNNLSAYNDIDIFSLQTTKLVNTAMLTGSRQEYPMQIYSLGQGGRVIDITEQTTCHSGDEEVLKVSVLI